MHIYAISEKLGLSHLYFDKKASERLTTYFATEIRYRLQKLIFLEAFKLL